jgi:RNA polymerase sigma-70 factor (ECF subfamily)
LAHEHYGLVFRFCARRIGAERAADAAQETFVTALRAVINFRGDSEAKTWLLGIAHNECRRVVRRDKIVDLAVELDPDSVSQASAETNWINRAVLISALRELSAEHREAVVMKEVDGLTYEEIGLILGVPAGTVKSRVHFGMMKLRETLRGSMTESEAGVGS